MMKTFNIALVASTLTTGGTNYIGLRPYIYIFNHLTLITMGHVLGSLWRVFTVGWLRGLKQTGMVARVFMRLKRISNNINYRKFINYQGQKALPYPTPPKEIHTMRAMPHTGWASIKNGEYLIPLKPNANGSQIEDVKKRIDLNDAFDVYKVIA